MKMKFALKLIAASLALAAANQAGAAIADWTTPGSSGSAEMFLAVWDSTAQTSYIRDLGVRMNDFMPALGTGTAFDKTTTGTNLSATGALAAPYGGSGNNSIGFAAGFGASPSVAAGSVLTSGYQLTFQADPLTSSFFSPAGGGLSTSLQWMVGAFDSVGAIGNQTLRGLTTSNGVVAGLNAPVANFGTTNGYIQLNNGLGTMTGPVNTNGSATAVLADGTPYFTGPNAQGPNWGSYASFSTLANVGSSQKFWYIATSDTTPADAATVKGFTNATWKLNTDGTLVYQVAAVPVPAAAWLFASGMLGLVGVARRRLQS